MTSAAPTSAYLPDGRQWAWDSTSLKNAEKCARFYFYVNLEAWQSPHLSVHLWFGSIYASAHEMFHKLEADGMSREDALRKIIHYALIESWEHERGEDGERIVNTGAPAEFDHNTKNRFTLIRSLVWYFTEFEDDHYKTYIKSDGSAGVEHSFRIEVDNNLLFCGHIDRLCKDPQDELFVHDQKTTGTTISPRYFNQFKPDTQFSMYTFASKMIYSAPVKGVIIDAAQIAVGFTRFGRSPTYRTEDELHEWYDEVMELISRIHVYHDRGLTAESFPRNPASCNNYGGCPFREVCSRPPGVRENFLKASFVQGDQWNPVKQR